MKKSNKNIKGPINLINIILIFLLVLLVCNYMCKLECISKPITGTSNTKKSKIINLGLQKEEGSNWKSIPVSKKKSKTKYSEQIFQTKKNSFSKPNNLISINML